MSEARWLGPTCSSSFPWTKGFGFSKLSRSSGFSTGLKTLKKANDNEFVHDQLLRKHAHERHRKKELRTCCEKLWLMKVASSARLWGELMDFPSSWGGSWAVSLTVNRSNSKKEKTKKKREFTIWLRSIMFPIPITSFRPTWIVSLIEEELVSDSLD